MNRWIRGASAMLLLWAGLGSAADIPLGGVAVTISLTNFPKITVEKPGGGWYDTLTLSNSAGSDTSRYQVQVPVQVNIRNERNFMVSLVNPLRLIHKTNPALAFTTEQVAFGDSDRTLQALSATPVNFANQSVVGKDSTGLYLLSVKARQPMGVLGSITGDYVGQLVLMFEVKV